MDSTLEKANQLLDRTTRSDVAKIRRKRTLGLLYNERYLTRGGLAMRLDIALGASPSMLDFITDIWFVWRAFRVDGFVLAYSLTRERQGFFLRGERAQFRDFSGDSGSNV